MKSRFVGRGLTDGTARQAVVARTNFTELAGTFARLYFNDAAHRMLRCDRAPPDVSAGGAFFGILSAVLLFSLRGWSGKHRTLGRRNVSPVYSIRYRG